MNFSIGIQCFIVALLAEGVDRNLNSSRLSLTTPVALLAEGVDRNVGKDIAAALGYKSPSSRRAWIEMLEEYD